MRRSLLIVLAVLVALVLIVLVLPLLVPMDAYRGQIESRASRATGRQLKIEGPLHLSLFPTLAVRAEDVTLANVPGGKAKYFASMKDLRVGVRLWPLLGGHLEVTTVTLDQPQIHLESDAQGHGNWVLGGAPAGTGAGEGGGGVAAAARARFDGIRIADGTVSYDDASEGVHRTLEHINITIDLTSLAEPVTIDGNLMTQGQKIALEGRIDSLQSLMTGAGTPVDLSLTSNLLQASFKGSLGRDRSDGLVKLDTPNLRKLMDWAGRPMAAGGGLGHLSLEGQVTAEGKVDRFAAIKLVLDKLTLKGALTLDRSGKVPAIRGQLQTGDLNLNPYLTTGGKSGTTAPAPQSPGWSKEPIDLAILGVADARLTLDIGSLEVRKLKLGTTHMVLTVADGALTADLNPVALYGGSGTAHLRVTAGGGTPQIANTLKFENLSARPFLSDALGITRIEGSAGLALDVTATGRSPDAIMHSLAGKGAVNFANGRIHGVDLASVASTIQTALSGKATSAGAATTFTAMGGSFSIARGVMTSKDFHLLSPFIRITGAGTVDLGNQRIDFVVKPRAVASLSGQGGAQNAAGIGVPFRIHGPWRDIHYTPDLSGVATSILDSVTKGGVSTKNVLEGLLGGVTGGSPQQDSSQKKTPPKKKNSPLDALEGLLGGPH